MNLKSEANSKALLLTVAVLHVVQRPEDNCNSKTISGSFRFPICIKIKV